MSRKMFSSVLVLGLAIVMTGLCLADQQVTGEMKQWYPVTITLDGPEVGEASTTFRNYRMDVTFSREGLKLMVPGYFAADGNAAHTSAQRGNKWRVNFTPDEPGVWDYRVSFHRGKDLAASKDLHAGEPGELDGVTGSFTIVPADPNAPGFYAKGLLQYVGEHFLQFAGTKEYFVKAGPGSPEDFLGYEDFDGTWDKGGSQNDDSLGPDGLHAYAPHVKDWQPGDPTWKNGKGKGIIGAVNYVAFQGVNTIYNVILTVNGDADTTWPWTEPTTHDIYDVSKLEQWDIVFTHMDAMGVNNDFYMGESENTRLLNKGELGTERVVFYRELMARFGYHLGWRWCIGEEPQALSTQQFKAIASHLRQLDPYKHAVGAHCGGKRPKRVPQYTPLLGYQDFEAAFSQINEDYHKEVLWLVRQSAATGHKWVVPLDEPNRILPKEDDKARLSFWKVVTAAGEGLGIYTAYKIPDYSDITIEDFRRLESIWSQMRYGIEFFQRDQVNRHLGDMVTDDTLVSDGYCFTKPGVIYVIYSRSASNLELDLGRSTDAFQVRWYNPRSGGEFLQGSVSEVRGPSTVSLGLPPSDIDQDWVAFVNKK